MDKYFIITIDTEGDNLWEYCKGDTITTHNSRYIPRFQNLCEKYGFKPVYLTNYEMLCDDIFVDYIRQKEDDKLCEIGLHLHAWNNPPIYELDGPYSGNPYLIEYPDNVMRAKFDFLYKLFCERIGHAPISHRSGRWAMDERYYNLLSEYDIKVDCSVTPHINWSRVFGISRGGTNYRNHSMIPYIVNGVYEIPLTVVSSHKPLASSIKQNIRCILNSRYLQLRPAIFSLKEMKYVVDKCVKNKSIDYVEFMMHSSELMPGGSPYFVDESAIESMYQNVESLFQYVTYLGYKGVTLYEYYTIKK